MAAAWWAVFSHIEGPLKVEIARFSIAGVLNTVVGYTVIFSGMAIGIGPYISNTIGYVAGISISFFLSRKYVFRSHGHVIREALRFVPCFLVAYLVNVLVLYLSFHFGINKYFSQVIAGASYFVSMFILSKTLVFVSKNIDFMDI